MLDENRLAKLERTVIELGAETHRLRNEVELYMESNVQLQSKFNLMKKILDERGLVLDEDFEIALQVQDRDPHLEEFQRKVEGLKKVLQ